jgi:nicotinamide riboside kinase
MKIALIGTHGIGKTTLCFDLAARLKRRNNDVELVREVARRCPMPINETTTSSAQAWILHTQIAEELAASADHDVVIADRSVLDNYCYMVHASGTSAFWETIIAEWLPTYDLLLHVPLWSKPSFDGIRAVDPRFQREIEVLLEDLIDQYAVTPLRLSAQTPDTWGADIEQALTPTLEPNLPLFE